MGGGEQLEGAPVELDRVVSSHLTLVFEARDTGQVQVRVRGSRAVGAIGLRGNCAKTMVETRQKVPENLIDLGDSGSAGPAEFSDQRVLGSSRGPLNPSLRLRGASKDLLNPQLPDGPAELGRLLIFNRTAAPFGWGLENAVVVAVHRQGSPSVLDDASGQDEIASMLVPIHPGARPSVRAGPAASSSSSILAMAGPSRTCCANRCSIV